MINKLKNVDSCCYQDVVLMSLFNTNFLKKLKKTKKCKDSYIISNQLILMNNYINDKNNTSSITCNTLRNVLKLCPSIDKFHYKTQNSSFEFIKYLFNMFGINDAKICKTFYGTNDGKTMKKLFSKKFNSSLPLIDIFTNNLDKRHKYYIKDFANFKQELNDINVPIGEYDNTIVKTELIESDMFIWYVNKNYDNVFDYNLKFVGDEYIKIKNNMFKLNSIICYRQHHYYSYILKDDGWYEYNDANNYMSFIGSYNQLYSIKGISNYSVIFVYVCI